MPSFLGKRQQHTANQANTSRLVTKIRWVIESANGRIKKWSYFYNTIENQNIPHIEKDFKNICAIINAFRPALTNVNDQEKIPLYKKMMLISMKENEFAAKALKFKQFISKKRKKFDHLTIAFPILTEEYIQYT